MAPREAAVFLDGKAAVIGERDLLVVHFSSDIDAEIAEMFDQVLVEAGLENRVITIYGKDTEIFVVRGGSSEAT